MVASVSKEKELFRYLGLLSNEVIQVQKTLQTIGSHEARVRTALDELALEKEILVEQTDRLETLVKQTATSAIVDAELEHERQEGMESEKVALQTQIMEMEESLQSEEAKVRELEEQFNAQLQDLTGQIQEKDRLLEVRDIAMKDLKVAADSLNRLLTGLSSNGDSRPVVHEEPQDDSQVNAADAIEETDEQEPAEIEDMEIDLQEKEWALGVKSLELEMNKQSRAGRVEESGTSVDAKSKKKPLRLVSLLSDMGGKRFL
jgi:hypothetical protein